MQVSPRVLGVSAAVLVAGVTAGAALGSVPPMQQRALQELLPEARTVALDYREQGDLPDHYPLITRAGRFDVHELGERGLYSQARYAYRQLDAYYPVEADDAGFDTAIATEAERPGAAATELTADDAARLEPVSDEPSAPLAPVGPAVAEVTPRTIDVQAELAGRY